MSRYDRSVQFAPFAALTGYDDAVRETARLTAGEIVLLDDEKDRIDKRIAYIMENISSVAEYTLTYFRPDEKKSGGEYVEKTGSIRRIDVVNGKVIFTDRSIVNIDRIIDVDGEVFDGLDI